MHISKVQYFENYELQVGTSFSPNWLGFELPNWLGAPFNCLEFDSLTPFWCEQVELVQGVGPWQQIGLCKTRFTMKTRIVLSFERVYNGQIVQ